MRASVVTVGVGLALAMACGASEDDPSTGPSLDTLPTQWTEVQRLGSGWTFANGCSVHGDLVIDGAHFRTGGCGGPSTSAATQGDRLVVELQDENSGEQVTLSFRWLDPAAGVGEWTWPGCFVQSLTFMVYDKAAQLTAEPGCTEQ